MKLYILILLIALLSCNNPKNCNKKEIELSKDITIEGWKKRDKPIITAKLYLYNENFNIKQDSINATYILNHLDSENPEPSESSIIFDKNLTTKNNYKLILNNTDIYYINKFNIIEEERHFGTGKKTSCELKNFRVNGVLVSEYPPYFSIRFKKSIQK